MRHAMAAGFKLAACTAGTTPHAETGTLPQMAPPHAALYASSAAAAHSPMVRAMVRARVTAQARARAAGRWAVWPGKWPASRQTAGCQHCHSQSGSHPCRCTCTCRRCPGTVCRRLRDLAAGGGCWSRPGGWWPTVGRTPHFGGCPARRLRAEDAGGQRREKSGHCFAIMPTALVVHASPAVDTPCQLPPLPALTANSGRRAELQHNGWSRTRGSLHARHWAARVCRKKISRLPLLEGKRSSRSMHAPCRAQAAMPLQHSINIKPSATSHVITTHVCLQLAACVGAALHPAARAAGIVHGIGCRVGHRWVDRHPAGSGT